MNKILYFNNKKRISNIENIILKLLPKNKEDAVKKAGKAESLLDPMQLIYYYGYIIAYGTLYLFPEGYKERVMNLIDAGILDDIVAHYAPNLTESYVTNNKFYYKQEDYELPGACVPRMRYIDENNKILVDCLDLKGDPIVFHFIPSKGEQYSWEIW